MNSQYYFQHRCRTFTRLRYSLIRTFCIGVFSGVFIAFNLDGIDTFWIRNITSGTAVTFNPTVLILFLLSSFFIFTGLLPTFFLLFFCFLRAFSLGFCLFLIVSAFYTAGWLVYGLVCFSCYLSTVPLLWFWLRYFNTTSQLKRDLLLSFLITLFICIVDRFFISPFIMIIL